MKINNRINNQINNQNNSNVNFKSKIPVKVFSEIQTTKGLIKRQATVNSNIETIIHKFVRILKGLDKTQNSDEIIARFKQTVPDNGLDAGKLISCTVRGNEAYIYTGKDAENLRDAGALMGRVKSAKPESESVKILHGEYEKLVASKNNLLTASTYENIFPHPTELHIFTSGKANFKNKKWFYKFEIGNSFFENKSDKEYRQVYQQKGKIDFLKAVALPIKKSNPKIHK